jgi:hypothetical protein
MSETYRLQPCMKNAGGYSLPAGGPHVPTWLASYQAGDYQVAIGDEVSFDPPVGNHGIVVDAQSGVTFGHWEQTVAIVVSSVQREMRWHAHGHPRDQQAVWVPRSHEPESFVLTVWCLGPCGSDFFAFEVFAACLSVVSIQT